jgi:acetyl/propionyl-CoA carboxylase alpha subunit
MYKISVNGKSEIPAEISRDGSVTLSGEKIIADIITIRDGLFHIIADGKSYNAEITGHNRDEKTFTIRVNNNTYHVKVSDQYDALLHELGMDVKASGKAIDLKAPMPGLVVEVAVREGAEVKKGDKLVVLEAMKMENILKAPADAVVKKILIEKGRSVEKNEVLVVFQ